MRKIKKNFIALLMVFTSIVSFLPGQAAKADVVTDASTSRINVDGSSTPLTRRVDSTSPQEEIYNTEGLEKAFDITVKNVSKSTDEWVNDSKNQKTSITGIVGQKVILKSINGTNLVESDAVTPKQAGYDIIKGMGINVSGNMVSNGSASYDTQLNSIASDADNTNIGPQQVDGINDPRVGVRIQDLPAGVDKITYDVQIETISVTYTPTLDSNGNPTANGTATAGSVSTKATSKTITIEHGSKYAISKISSMQFKSYVGDLTAFDSNDTIQNQTQNKNNTVPFLYTTTATPDSSMPLRYKFDVPDSIQALKYVMTFGDFLQLNNGIDLYKNGEKAVQGKDYSLSGEELTGGLTKNNQPDLIVIRVKSVTSTSGGTSTITNISKAYSIEIRYNQLSADQDYSLSKAGITKLNYDSNSGVEAYIGKTFNVTDNKGGFKEYNGNIYIDQRAGMISIDPTLIRPKDTVAYVVTNNYKDSTNTTRIKKSILKNGKQFIDFMASTSDNQLQIDVYAGKDGNITDSSTILARYILKVNPISTNAFSMDLTFGTTGAAATYLTQPGVKENVINKFTTDRRTYDLYYGSPDVDTVNVNFSGTRSNLNEYVRVWLADDINSNNLTEAQASANNLPNSSNLRNRSINVKVGTAKKMVVQAYYDEFQYNADGTPKLGSDGNQVYNSYPIGDTYIFYLPENYTSTTPGKGENSSDASLILLKAKDYTLTDSNGKTGFSSNTFDYTTTVNKDDTTVKLTATANDDNVKSITASITGSDQTYTLGSGQEEELPLNSSGTTIVKVVVTAQDGSTTKTYSIVITNNTKSSNIKLKNVILSTGEFTFDPAADVTKVRVDPNITSIKVTPVPEDSKSKVSVNGDDYSNTAIDVSLKGSQKTEISIEVTSEDGKLSKTYTLEIYRVDSASWDNDSNNNNNSSDTDDQYYDEYNDTWVDLSKYDEWGTVNGKPAYFDKHNRQVKNAWISTNGKYYYLNNLGYRASGWKVDSTDGKSYYLDPTTGEMKTGWINLNNTWYYLDLNGVMHKGWLSLNKKWYYFTPNGQMVINQSMYIDDKLCIFGQDGALIA